MTDATQLLIEGARAKLNGTGEITEVAILEKVKALITSFDAIMNNETKV